MSEHEKNTISAIANEIFNEFQKSGHLCLHEEDWGEIRETLKTIKERQAEIKTMVETFVKTQDEHEKRIGKIETVGWCIGIVIGASWAVFLIALDKLWVKIGMLFGG